MAYSKEQVEETFERIIKAISQDGDSLRSALQRHDMPSSKTFFKWLEEDNVKVKQYASACEERADEIFEEILTIADDSSGDTTTLEDGREVFNSEFAARSRIRVDARKWVVARMNPKKYGDKMALDIDGEIKIQPLKQVVFKQSDE